MEETKTIDDWWLCLQCGAAWNSSCTYAGNEQTCHDCGNIQPFHPNQKTCVKCGGINLSSANKRVLSSVSAGAGGACPGMLSDGRRCREPINYFLNITDWFPDFLKKEKVVMEELEKPFPPEFWTSLPALTQSLFAKNESKDWREIAQDNNKVNLAKLAWLQETGFFDAINLYDKQVEYLKWRMRLKPWNAVASYVGYGEKLGAMSSVERQALGAID